VLGLYGSEDQSIPVEEVRQMEEAFAEAGITHEIQVYEGAGHAFFNDTRDSYDEDAAADAWPRTLEWFRTHL
jgi:carboxymethylenebutenolidase